MLKLRTKNSICFVLFIIFLVFFIKYFFQSTDCVEYKFINSYIPCDYEKSINKKEYREFRSYLNEYIEKKKSEGKASVVSVWFRDLEFGPTFGLNERVDFIPASLLKLPLAMTFYQIAEDDPAILNQTIEYSVTPFVPMQTFLPPNIIEKDKEYTIEELIVRSIINSDNIASQLLFEYLVKNYDDALSQTYRDLGILEPGTDLSKAAVNTKGYGSIFRLLYNISFLDRDFSEKVLVLLAESEFNEGLRKGVPDHISIAHKFGERYLKTGEKQLHDCGVIYYPNNPYLLCIMTRGDNFDNLKQIIQEISKLVYEEFDSRKLND